jgi:hypothetical protein
MTNTLNKPDIAKINQDYLQAFQQHKYPDAKIDPKKRISWNQYKSALTNYVNTLNDDALLVPASCIENFLSNTKNVRNKRFYLKGFYMFLITTDYKDARSRISRELLLKLLEM